MSANTSPLSTCAKCLEDFKTEDLSLQMICPDCEPSRKEKITSLFFEGQQWTPNDGGVYQSVRVWANGYVLGSVEWSYGYGRQYEDFGLQFLLANGLLTTEQINCTCSAWHLSKFGIAVYSTLTHGKKRELLKANRISDHINLFAPIA